MPQGDRKWFDKDLWYRAWAATQRLIVLMLLIGMHYLVSLALKATIPPILEKALDFAEAVVYVFFLLIYVYLLADMVLVFMPWLRRGRSSPAQPVKDRPADEPATEPEGAE